MISKIKTTKDIDCSLCGAIVKVSSDVASVLCSHCIMESWEIPVQEKKKNIGYPKGWRFMSVFVHANGTVYYKGVEQPELFGTLKATPIVEKPKVTKKQKAVEKQSLLEEYASLKKKLKTEKKKVAKKKIEKRLNQISKLIQ